MTALTIGFFDGVHRGHQHILQALKATGCKTTVVTFSNHPASVLGKSVPPLLTPPHLKVSLLKEQGIDEVIVLPFDAPLSQKSYEEFLAPYNIDQLFLGEDAALGQGRQGRPEALRLLGLQKGFTVHCLSKCLHKGEPISSTRIRALIAAGHLTEAEELLGRPHCFYYNEDPAVALPPDGDYPVRAYSPAGHIATILSIQDGVPSLPLEAPQLVSFGPNPINPHLFNPLCQTSLAES